MINAGKPRCCKIEWIRRKEGSYLEEILVIRLCVIDVVVCGNYSLWEWCGVSSLVIGPTVLLAG